MDYNEDPRALKYARDYHNTIQYAYEEGKEEFKKQVVRNMHELDFSVKKIAQALQFSIAE